MKATTTVILLASGVAAQQRRWEQCGGIGWTGETNCVSGSFCQHGNDWYSQCLPTAAMIRRQTSSDDASTSTTSTPTTATNTSEDPSLCPDLPPGLGGGTSQLNDPFTFHDGTTSVTSKALWTCRRAEILEHMQQYELGIKPSEAITSATLSGSNLLTMMMTVTVTDMDMEKSISFSVTITKPNTDTGPFPAILHFGASSAASIPIPAGVATIAFNNDEIAAQSGSGSRGSGKFYDLYGSSHGAGALTAWAWAVSRVLDGLEQVGLEAGIDVARVGVTGCSRNGKGAFVAGALDERVALTLPQESGAGGAGCWRLENWMNGLGFDVQGPQQIVGENPWFGPAFDGYVDDVDSLPFDHHLLVGLVAPRPLYVMENPDFEWLGTMSTYGCMGAGKTVYDALGATDQFGYSQVGGHGHCSFPNSQAAELNAFINRYLLQSGSESTGVYRTDQTYSQFNMDDWVTWSTPNLS